MTDTERLAALERRVQDVLDGLRRDLELMEKFRLPSSRVAASAYREVIKRLAAALAGGGSGDGDGGGDDDDAAAAIAARVAVRLQRFMVACAGA